jgi:hypothetical protein
VSRIATTLRAFGGTARALAATLLVIGAPGCAQRSDWVEGTLVTVDVTGVWKGRSASMGGTSGVTGEFELTLTQRGPKVTGDARIRTLKVGIEGIVRGDVFSFSAPGGRLRAEARVNGDEMSGEGRTDVAGPSAGQHTPFRFTLVR